MSRVRAVILVVLLVGAVTAGALDFDDDQLATHEEIRSGTNPLAADSDGDGLNDHWETEHATDPRSADTDNDGLEDDREVDIGTDPVEPDTDADGFTDGIEANGASSLPELSPTEKDIVVEVDVMEDVEEQISYDDIESQFSEHGLNLHLVVDEPAVSGPRTIYANNLGGGENLRSYRGDHFDRTQYPVHYLLIVDNTETSYSDNSFTPEHVGYATNGTMIVQTHARVRTEATIMHELGHSLGLRYSVFDGIDAYKYTMSDYESVMNYRADGYLGYSDSSPFNDWEWIRENMYIPYSS